MIELESILASPVDGSPLRRVGDVLKSESGHEFPFVEGIPVLLMPGTNDTIGAMAGSRIVASATADERKAGNDPYYLESLGLTPEERLRFKAEVSGGDMAIDPVVAFMVCATNGILYRNLVGRLPRYPIPNFRLKNGQGKLMLDLGCNWGRWCIAAAREGFTPVGIDPQIGAVLAARRVAKQLGIKAHFVCGDARHLPFRKSIFDTVFSYSVLQHLAREDVALIAKESHRVLKNYGETFIQMPNAFGIRCLQHQLKRGFREAHGFQVRYWTLGQLRSLFEREIGMTQLEIDCFFGLGLQASDVDIMPPLSRVLIGFSEYLRKVGSILPVLSWAADSVYVHSRKNVPSEDIQK